MKEKIGKLLELLNECQKENKRPIFYNYNKKSDFFECGSISGIQTFGESGLTIISKRFGFIKWLVENDRVKPLGKFIGWETDEDEPYIQFDLVDQYIAYLSIQDEPIRFLCEILK